jgi:hypothetical protein
VREEPRYEAPRYEEPRREEPQREEPQRAEPSPAPRVEAPRIDPKEYLESAGLVMIETDRAKAPVQPQAEEQPMHVGRPRRERPKSPAQDDALVQIETTRK